VRLAFGWRAGGTSSVAGRSLVDCAGSALRVAADGLDLSGELPRDEKFHISELSESNAGLTWGNSVDAPIQLRLRAC